MKKSAIKKALNQFKIQKVLTAAKLVVLLSCTPRTVRRYLKKWQALGSYNQSGRYYTLPHIAKFNAEGFWRYGEAYFSKYGNLKETVIYLICHSKAGLSGRELGDLVGLDPRSFLWHFHDEKAIKREKINGRFIYCSSLSATRKKQLKHRREQEQSISKTMPNDAEAVMILVEYIKYPESSFEELSNRVREFKIKISPEHIANFFQHHGLAKKTHP